MSSNPINNRDTKNTSRKGRPAIGEKTMTAAERKRKQRDREREQKFSDPSWLRLRKGIFAMVLEQYPFANVGELASALQAVSTGLSVANHFHAAKNGLAKRTLQGIAEPETVESMFALFPEFMPYSPDAQLTDKYPSTLDQSLMELYCDIFDSHESINEQRKDINEHQALENDSHVA